MPRNTATLAALSGAAALVALAALFVPTSGAGADAGSCIAWGTLPARVVLGPSGATVRTTLHGTAGCTAESFDNGGTAVLAAPSRRDDEPIRWSHFGASDQATYYPSLDRPGTYRLVGGNTQTYDAQEEHIPGTWRATATVVKYRGRFVHVAAGNGVRATLQSYGPTGWAAQTGVHVALQRHLSDGTWRTVARRRTTGSGSVRFRVALGNPRNYRLVSATTASTWSTSRPLARPGV